MLAEHGADAKVLAGGQSLVPVLAMRLAEPAHLVDINRIGELDTVDVGPAGVTVGALARHSRVEHDAAAAGDQPLLRQALRLVAHPTIRNRGTTVGSLAHADPAGEMTAVLALCGGTVTARLGRGERVIAAADFFLGPLESELRPRRAGGAGVLPGPARRGRYGVRRDRPPARRLRALRGGGHRRAGRRRRAAGLRCALPVGHRHAAGARPDRRLAVRRGRRRRAGQAAVDPQSDLHATADYRRHLAGVLTIRAARQAISAAERGERAA